MFQMNFSGDASNGKETLFKIEFSIDIRDQLAKKTETDSAMVSRFEKMNDETLRSELWAIAYNDSYIYNIISEFINCEISDYADENDINDREYENISCENREFIFSICGRVFEFQK
jgi:hypothetical protein